MRGTFMTIALWLAATQVGLMACQALPQRNRDAARFYYPTGVVHLDVPGSREGVLVVVSANLDKRFTRGWVTALNLDEVSDDAGRRLPNFGEFPSDGPPQLPNLGDATTIGVASFGGEIGKLALSATRTRVFIPSRSEGMKVMAIDVGQTLPPTLTCFPPLPAGYEGDCSVSAPTLTPAALEASDLGLPRAPSPFGVSVKPRACTSDSICGADRHCDAGTCENQWGEPLADVWITHIQQADSPYGKGTNYASFLVRLESDTMRLLGDDSFTYIGLAASSSVAAGKRWIYVTGRYVYPTATALRFVDGAALSHEGIAVTSDAGVVFPNIEADYASLEMRGIALSPSESNAYLLGRGPDVLLEAPLVNIDTNAPSSYVSRATSLPSGPSAISLLPRDGGADLLAITCSGAGVLALYDQKIGQLVAQIEGVGGQPFGIAYSLRGAGARLFVSNFFDGRIAVIDIPDLQRAGEARLVAHIGARQICLSDSIVSGECKGVAR